MSFPLYPSNQAYLCVWKRITETPASLATGLVSGCGGCESFPRQKGKVVKKPWVRDSSAQRGT